MTNIGYPCEIRFSPSVETVCLDFDPAWLDAMQHVYISFTITADSISPDYD